MDEPEKGANCGQFHQHLQGSFFTNFRSNTNENAKTVYF